MCNIVQFLNYYNVAGHVGRSQCVAGLSNNSTLANLIDLVRK